MSYGRRLPSDADEGLRLGAMGSVAGSFTIKNEGLDRRDGSDQFSIWIVDAQGRSRGVYLGQWEVSPRADRRRGVWTNRGALMGPTFVSPGGVHSQLVGAWLMPDNELPGMLEDFIVSLRPADDVLLPHVDALLQGLPAPDVCPRRFAEVHRAKARVRAFLAIQREPGKPLGQAISSHYLDGSSPQATAFVAWLRRLFLDA